MHDRITGKLTTRVSASSSSSDNSIEGREACAAPPLTICEVCQLRYVADVTTECPLCSAQAAWLAVSHRACAAPTWQPMETMPHAGQVIVCWNDKPEYDTIGRAEYLEILGFGEPPALGWMPLPAPPSPAAKET